RGVQRDGAAQLAGVDRDPVGVGADPQVLALVAFRGYVIEAIVRAVLGPEGLGVRMRPSDSHRRADEAGKHWGRAVIRERKRHRERSLTDRKEVFPGHDVTRADVDRPADAAWTLLAVETGAGQRGRRRDGIKRTRSVEIVDLRR